MAVHFCSNLLQETLSLVLAPYSFESCKFLIGILSTPLNHTEEDRERYHQNFLLCNTMKLPHALQIYSTVSVGFFLTHSVFVYHTIVLLLLVFICITPKRCISKAHTLSDLPHTHWVLYHHWLRTTPFGPK